jgi:hypothetical protein
MTTDFTDSVTNAGDFEEALDDLLVAADKNDIAVEGGWSPKSLNNTTWDVVITEVAPADD